MQSGSLAVRTLSASDAWGWTHPTGTVQLATPDTHTSSDLHSLGLHSTSDLRWLEPRSPTLVLSGVQALQHNVIPLLNQCYPALSIVFLVVFSTLLSRGMQFFLNFVSSSSHLLFLQCYPRCTLMLPGFQVDKLPGKKGSLD